MARVDGRADVSRGLAVEVSAAKQGVDARRRVDQVGDQAAEGGEGRAMPVPQPPLVEPVDQVAGALGHRAH